MTHVKYDSNMMCVWEMSGILGSKPSLALGLRHTGVDVSTHLLPPCCMSISAPFSTYWFIVPNDYNISSSLACLAAITNTPTDCPKQQYLFVHRPRDRQVHDQGIDRTVFALSSCDLPSTHAFLMSLVWTVPTLDVLT